MTSSTLYLLGTPGGLWPALIGTALARSRPEATSSEPVASCLCIDAASTEAALAAAPTHSQWLVFVEDPTEGLAMALGSDDPPDPQPWLQDWERGSRALLRLAQSQRTRCLFVDAAEAASAPSALRERLLGWTAGAMLLPAASGNPPMASIDPLCRAVAVALAGAQASTVRTYRELHACCDWLDGGPVGPVASQPQATIDGKQVVQRLVALHRQAGDLLAANAASERSAERIAALESELQSANRSLQAVKHAAQDARTESDLLLQRLHEAQEAHEQAELRLRAAHAERTESPAATTVADADFVHIDEVQVTSTRNERPYREIAYTLRGVRIGIRRVATASVRLVEHHGHPGLALFAPKGQASDLLGAWQPSGQEDERAFMLFIPSDDQGLALTHTLGGADWITLLAVVARIEATLRTAAPAQQRAWLPLARRLREQLDCLPPRLRWAAVEASAVAGAAPSAIDLTLHQVSWGVRRLPQLFLRWQPEGAGEGIALSRPLDGDEPLLSWPDDAHGDSPDRLWLATSAAGVDRDFVSDLRSQDLAFVRALLEAWPTIVSALPSDSAGLPANADRARLAQSSATRILRQLAHADAARQGDMLRRVGRRLLRGARAAA